MQFTTQYTSLLLELERYERRSKERKDDHDNATETTGHRPMQLGGFKVDTDSDPDAQAA